MLGLQHPPSWTELCTVCQELGGAAELAERLS